MAKFRKVYLIVDGTKIFGEYNYEVVNIMRDKGYAERVCAGQQRTADDELHKMYNKDAKPKKLKVHAYYLVHASFFDDE
jgi:hypothetical protein|nr:hypothetical protein [uncultured Mucilaginibacter sp.]